MMKFFHSVATRLTLIFLTVALFGCFHDSNNDDTVQDTNNDDTMQSTNLAAGVWPGNWSNTTFGSQGPLTLNITDNGDGTLTVTFDLDGFVGGMFDPDPQTVIATVDANGDASFSGNIDMMGMQGQLNFTLKSNGDLSISLPSIPLAGFKSFTATGTMTASKLSLNYDVFFSPSGSATGTATATKS